MTDFKYCLPLFSTGDTKIPPLFDNWSIKASGIFIAPAVTIIASNGAF